MLRLATDVQWSARLASDFISSSKPRAAAKAMWGSNDLRMARGRSVAAKAVWRRTDRRTAGMLPSRWVAAVIGQRSAEPPAVSRYLALHGADAVVRLGVQRLEISRGVQRTLDVLTLGTWERTKRELGHNKLYHSRFLIVLRCGEVAILDKREVVHLVSQARADDVTTNPKPVRTIWIQPPQCTLAQFLRHAANDVGPKFWHYNPRSNNCHDFVIGVLRSWRLLTPELEREIRQPVDDLLSHPLTQAWATSVPDMIARAGIVVNGCDANNPSCIPYLRRTISRKCTAQTEPS
jgi:hypothetical protein